MTEPVELDVVPLLVDMELAETLGDHLRCGCVWWEGRHALIARDCWLHSPCRPWGLFWLRSSRKVRPVVQRMLGWVGGQTP